MEAADALAAAIVVGVTSFWVTSLRHWWQGALLVAAIAFDRLIALRVAPALIVGEQEIAEACGIIDVALKAVTP